MNPYHHALSSVARYGGKWEDYIEIHHWFDGSKRSWTDPRHRALRHHSEGIYDCEEKFGYAITNSNGRVIPTRYIGEDHVKEDLGFIPSMKDWFQNIKLEKWMVMTMRPKTETKEKLMSNIPAKLELSR